MTTNKNLFYFLIFLAMVGWGASWVNIKVLGSYLNEFETMFVRFFITFISMVPILIYLKKPLKLGLKNFFWVLLASISLMAYMKYFYLGVKFGTAGLGGAFVTSLIPIITFLILVILGNKSITKKRIFALCLGAVGVMTMLNVWAFEFEQIFVIQNLYFIFAAFLWALLTIVSSKATDISPIVFTFYLYIFVCILNSIFFVDITSIDFKSLDFTFWLNMLIISLVATTFSNTIYFLGIEGLGAANVSTFIFLVPFAAIILSAIFLKEKITFSVIMGTLFSVIAVKILNDIKLKGFKSKSCQKC